MQAGRLLPIGWSEEEAWGLVPRSPGVGAPTPHGPPVSQPSAAVPASRAANAPIIANYAAVGEVAGVEGCKRPVIGNGRDRCGPLRGKGVRLQKEFAGMGLHDDRTD